MHRSALSPTLRVTIIDTIIVTYSDFESGPTGGYRLGWK